MCVFLVWPYRKCTNTIRIEFLVDRVLQNCPISERLHTHSCLWQVVVLHGTIVVVLFDFSLMNVTFFLILYVTPWTQTSMHCNSTKMIQPYLRVYKPHLFGQEFTLQNSGAAGTRNMSFWRLSPRRRYCMLWNSQWRPLVFETYLASYCTRANAPTYYRCVGVTPLIPRSRKTVISLTNYRKCC
jgi:hypothetical protein